MSYELVTPSVGSDQIKFFHTITSIFDNVKMHTHYRSKTLKDEKGVPLMDDYAMSDNETDAFMKFFKAAIYQVFQSVVKKTKGISDSVFINTDCGTASTSPLLASGFSILDTGGYVENILALVDNDMEECYVYFVCAKWYQMMGVDAEYSKFWTDYLNKVKELKNDLWELAKPLIA